MCSRIVASKDEAFAAGAWHVTPRSQRLIGNVEALETEIDPDANEGLRWKNPQCEEDPSQDFSAGPQSNAYHLTRVSGGTALVADAAGNQLLEASLTGWLDWVTVFTPLVADGSSSDLSTRTRRVDLRPE